MAVKNGMDSEKALSGITLTAAKNCGIDSRVGSIEVGKDADFCVFSEDIFSFNARNLMTFINGRLVFDANK